MRSPSPNALAPRYVVSVGASEASPFGAACLRNLLQRKSETVAVDIVHPTRDTVAGRRTYQSLGDLRRVPDCVVVCVGRERVMSVLTECVALDVQSAVVFATGFEESNDALGPQLARDMAALAHDSGMTIVGPNCLGYINLLDGVAAYSGAIPSDLRAGSVSLISQSGGLLAVLLEAAAVEGLGVGTAVSSGNETATSVARYVQMAVEDDRIDTIGLVIEGIRDASDLLTALAAARDGGKSVVGLKLGQSAAGARAARSHTGNLGSDYERVRSVLEQLDVLMTDNLGTFIAALAIGRSAPVSLSSVAVVACSGGTAALSADSAARFRVPLAELDSTTLDRLATSLPAHLRIGNPLDLVAPTAEGTSTVLETLDAVDEAHLILLVLPLFRSPELTVKSIMAAAQAAGSYTGRTPVVACTVSPGSLSASWQGKFPGLPVVDGLDAAMSALGLLSRRAERVAAGRALETEPARQSGAGRGLVLPEPEHGLWSEPQMLTSLEGAGLPVVRRTYLELGSAGGVPSLAEDAIGEYPVVVKIDSPDIAHKSKVGGVRTGVASAAEAREAMTEMLSAVSSHRPDARVRGILIEEQVSSDYAEMFIGALVDPVLGRLIAYGFGGVDIEQMPSPIFASAAIVQRTDVYAALRQSATAELVFDGRHEVDAFVDLVARVAELWADASGSLEELDLNPVMVGPPGAGAVIVDALGVARGTER